MEPEPEDEPEMELEPSVIQRLQKSHERDVEAQFQRGREWGITWAKHHAEACELRRLREEWDRAQTVAEWNARLEAGPFVWLYEVIAGRSFTVSMEGADESLAFWRRYTDIGPKGYPGEHLMRGFADGAWDVWDSAMGKLRP